MQYKSQAVAMPYFIAAMGLFVGQVLFGLMSKLSPEGAQAVFKAGVELETSYGYTTANEGRMFGPMHDVMVDAARRGVTAAGCSTAWPTPGQSSSTTAARFSPPPTPPPPPSSPPDAGVATRCANHK